MALHEIPPVRSNRGRRFIATVDEEGVVLAAIQSLTEKLDAQDAEIDELKQKAKKVESLEKQDAAMATRLSDLEAAVRAPAGSK